MWIKGAVESLIMISGFGIMALFSVKLLKYEDHGARMRVLLGLGFPLVPVR